MYFRLNLSVSARAWLSSRNRRSARILSSAFKKRAVSGKSVTIHQQKKPTKTVIKPSMMTEMY